MITLTIILLSLSTVAGWTMYVIQRRFAKQAVKAADAWRTTAQKTVVGLQQVERLTKKRSMIMLGISAFGLLLLIGILTRRKSTATE